jgi:prepilin-type processing-associated H-X9-DG protein
VGGPKDPYLCITWCARLLPSLEQEAAWAQAVEDYKAQPIFTAPVPHRNLARPFKVFTCPAGDRDTGTTVEGTTASFTYYLGVSADVGERRNGLLYVDSAHRLADVRDGTSNTLIFGERPPSADNHFGWWYAGIGMKSFDGSADSVMAAHEVNRTFRAPTCPRGPYPFQPGRLTDMCSTFHFWSLHSSGAHFTFADGSVRFLRYDADSVLPALATRAGGEAVTVPE